jgi:hypothetical protein
MRDARSRRIRVCTKGGSLSGGQESAESSFVVGFLTMDGKPLTIIGPPDALDALTSLLKDAAEIELHRFDRTSATTRPPD